ncbi:hypothetical protein [Salininema proteolyticum]|uniref:N-acetyltransferase domain-containing protein n=1 Tax=Salininema proteolyticum TaxID=1607685 RepID=A0ABV8U455_9ACTN
MTATPDPAYIRLIHLGYNSKFTHDPRFTSHWWEPRQGPQGRERFSAFLNDKEVARASCSIGIDLFEVSAYVTTATSQITEIDLFETASDVRRNGIGAKVAQLIAEQFPGAVYALAKSEEAGRFWASLGWREFENVQGRDFRVMYLSDPGTPVRSWAELTDVVMDVRSVGPEDVALVFSGLQHGKPFDITVEVNQSGDEVSVLERMRVTVGATSAIGVINEIQEFPGLLAVFWDDEFRNRVGNVALRIVFRNPGDSIDALRHLVG